MASNQRARNECSSGHDVSVARLFTYRTVNAKAGQAARTRKFDCSGKVATDVLIMVFTGVIAFVAVVQAVIFGYQWKAMSGQLAEMKSGSADTRTLAEAAKAQASKVETISASIKQAANAMDTSNINAKEALTKTLGQNQIALDAALAASRLDQRPWVGLQLLQCNNCRMEADGILIVGDLSAVLVNTGKTPAIDMVVRYTFESISASDPIPTYDVIEKENEARRKRMETIPPDLPPEMVADIAKTLARVKRRIEPSKEVLAPNAPRGITIIAGFRQERSKMTIMTGQNNVVYGLGKITYYDTSRTIQHATMFCVMNDIGSDFRYCPVGNEMK